MKTICTLTTLLSLFPSTMLVFLAILLGLSSSAAWLLDLSTRTLKHDAGFVDPNFMGFAFEIASFVPYATGEPDRFLLHHRLHV